jgi:DNA-binding NarL/FixJ family response regulator
MKILLAENQGDVRSALKLLLEEVAGVPVSMEVRNAEDLKTLAASDCPDIIVVDWDLPGSTGPELIDTLKQLWTKPLIITLGGTPEIEKKAMGKGVDGFICKGSLPQQVIATIIRCLEKRYPVYE